MELNTEKADSMIEELKNYLTQIKSGALVRHPLVTHMSEILALSRIGLREFCVESDSFYTSDSRVMQLLFVDGKKYEIEIREGWSKK